MFIFRVVKKKILTIIIESKNKDKTFVNTQRVDLENWKLYIELKKKKKESNINNVKDVQHVGCAVENSAR